MGIENLFHGIVDIHVHSKPDIRPRTYSDIELMEVGVRVNARAIVTKNHFCPTAGRAKLVNEIHNQRYGDSNDFELFGSIVLNDYVGGLNPKATEISLEMGAKIVWLPTIDSANDRFKWGKSGGIHCYKDGKVAPELKDIFSLIKQHNAVLATGHLSYDELGPVLELARNIGVEKIVIDHPEYWVVGLSIEQQKQLTADYAVYFGRYFAQPLAQGGYEYNMQYNLKAIREVGYENTIISTDGGQIDNPKWEDALGQYLEYLIIQGVPQSQINYMAKELPAKLLGIL